MKFLLRGLVGLVLLAIAIGVPSLGDAKRQSRDPVANHPSLGLESTLVDSADLDIDDRLGSRRGHGQQDEDADSDRERGRHSDADSDSDSDKDSDKDSDRERENRPPRAALRIKNLTRDPNALNWVRLDARDSKGRGSRIVHYRYAVQDANSGRSLHAPGATASRVAHVQISPGRYIATLTVTDDRGLTQSRSRRFRIRGTPQLDFTSSGSEWALDESWRLGDPSFRVYFSNASIDFGEIAEIFAGSGVLSESAVTATSLTSSGSNCGSTRTKAGFWTGVAGGMLGVGLSLIVGPEAGVATKLVIGGATEGVKATGSHLSMEGGSAANTCLQNEIDNLAYEMDFQSRQILQIQNQLDLTDTAFFTAWSDLKNAEDKAWNDAFFARVRAFSPSGGDPTTCSATTSAGTEDCPCLEPNYPGPADSCSPTELGFFGSFMREAGLWIDDPTTGWEPATGLCNQPFDSTTTCNSLLQTETSWEKLSDLANSTTDFESMVNDLSGTQVSSCGDEPWTCISYDPNSLLLETLESLYKNLVGEGGQIELALPSDPNDPDSRTNIVELIDAYNQTLTMYIEVASTALSQAFNAEWIVNNFNFYSWSPYGLQFEFGPDNACISQLSSTFGTWFCPATSVTDSANPFRCEISADPPPIFTPSGNYDDIVCAPKTNSAAGSGDGYVCDADSGTFAGMACSPNALSSCGGGDCVPASPCDTATASECQLGNMAPDAYNAAQLALTYTYVQRFNQLYELYLRYLVTDLPRKGSLAEVAPLQSWPEAADGGRCLIHPTRVAAGDAPPLTSCTRDADCDPSSKCVIAGSLDWPSIVTAASASQPGVGTRTTALLSQPLGWVSKQNLNFDAPPFASGTSGVSSPSCYADYGSEAGDPVSSGQPGYLAPEDVTSKVCPSGQPYCVGYQVSDAHGNVQDGSCTDTPPWTASSVLYQYALIDPYACREVIESYNLTTPDDPPNLFDAWEGDGCQSLFAVPGGQAPRYGYFDGATLQPYSFELGALAAEKDEICDPRCYSPTCSDGLSPDLSTPAGSWSQSCHDSSYDATTRTLCATCTAENSDQVQTCQTCPSETWSNMDGQLTCVPGFVCLNYELTRDDTDHTVTVDFDGEVASGACSPIVGLVADGASSTVCPAFCAADSSNSLYCVDTSYAQQTKGQAAPIDCQACASGLDGEAAKVLALAGPMQGNLAACAIGTGGDPAAGPKMDWYAPDSSLTFNLPDGAQDNAAMLCEGCVYLGCGNYQALVSSTLPIAPGADYPSKANSMPTIFGNWMAGIDATGNSTTPLPYGSCSTDASTDNGDCTVAGNAVGTCSTIPDWLDNDHPMMLTSMVSDYRCGYLGGKGVSFVGITNDGGYWFGNLNSAAQNGAYPWGCGAFGFDLETDVGQDGITNYAALVFEQPNLVSNTWDPVVPDGSTHLAIPTGLTASGPQMGLDLVSQCSDNCPNSASTGLGSPYSCFSVATPATPGTMDSLGYACRLEDFSAVTLPDGSSGTQQGLVCVVNDGREYAVRLKPIVGGLPQDPESTGPTTMTFDQDNVACPAECKQCQTGGFTFGAMDLTSEGSCAGFCSGDNYCGGYCYNQADATTSRPPVDCRQCPWEQDYGECPESHPFVYSGNGVLGSYCCGYPPGSTGEYGSTVIDHCLDNEYVVCPDPPCVSHGSSPVASAAGTDSCYPWGNTSMWPLFPFTY